jgi:hypothetical protein
MAKCRTCRAPITEPHEWNNFDLWCARCHAKARGRDKPESYLARYNRCLRNFQRRVRQDGNASKLAM